MKMLKFAAEYLLMHIVAMMWKVYDMPAEDIELFWNNRWALTLICCVLSFVIGICIAHERSREDLR